VHKGVIHSILSRLPDDYDTIVTVLNISHELDLGDILEQLVNQEEELNCSKEVGADGGEIALGNQILGLVRKLRMNC
jgi:hypothetical protein